MRKKILIGKNSKILNKKTTVIGEGVSIGNNVLIYGNSYILGESAIGDNCIILPNCFIENCEIGRDVQIENSTIKDSFIGDNCTIGPYARIRPDCFIDDNCKVGNFVELKNATLGKGTKVSHLSYVGDCEIGKNCNIGCGVIFVNYNGKTKNKTLVGNNCFIGSNSNIIAPVKIADNCYICAGTTITEDLKENDFAIGRSRPEIKPNRAQDYL